MNKGLEKIAKEVLEVGTIETRNSDRLDFHEVAIWSIVSALEKAYELGLKKNIKILKEKDKEIEDLEDEIMDVREHYDYLAE